MQSEDQQMTQLRNQLENELKQKNFQATVENKLKELLS